VNIFINDVKDLHFSIFVIGYCEKGESLILFLKDKSTNRILYTIVVDCYECHSHHKTIEILSEHNINNIDLLCWTHPDDDHTKGLLKLVNEKCSKSTIFLLPEGIHGKEGDVLTYNEEEIEILQKINSFNRGTNYNVRTVSTNPMLSQGLIKKTYKDLTNNASVMFEISALAPCSPILRRRIETEPNKVKKNDFSIALLINLGELQFLLSGDVENQSIRQIDEDFINNLCFIKTPHHTSKSSDLLLTKLNNSIKIPVSCTTVYKANYLPDTDLITEYKKYCDKFHSTGIKNSKNDKYGVVEYGFDVISKDITTLQLYGNAVES